MKKIPLIIILLIVSKWGFGSNWQPVKSGSPSPIKVSLVSSNIATSVLNLSLPGFTYDEVTTARGAQFEVNAPGGIPLEIKGAPSLQRVAASLIIPNSGSTTVTVLAANYKDYDNVEIAPSRGIIYYSQDASTIPYEYGEVYQKDAFFPGDLAELRDPHIMRNVRGQVIDIYPFQYNPVKKTLRVYSDITVEVKTNLAERGVNYFTDVVQHTNAEAFDQIYENNYLNYNAYKSGQRAVTDNPNGRMLIICYDNFRKDIQPFVDWKTLKGIETEVVNVSTIGATSAAIKTYVDKYYDTHADFTYLVLVGDHAQIPATQLTKPQKFYSDAAYIQIKGSDVYPEVICGRISAETSTDVQTQVTKFLTYEKSPRGMAGDRFSTSATISLKIGPDNKTQVYLDMRAIKTTLSGAGYKCTELFEGNMGDLAPTAANINSTMNAGQGFVSWISHGQPTGLASFPCTNSTVKSLTNTTMWPMIWNCSCQTGNFCSTTCFAETWLRASSGGTPVGAIGCAMSTRDMPMGPSEKYGNDAAKRIIDNNRKNQTYGGITYDTYLKVAVADYKQSIEFTCMVIFGDPSLMIRTKAPSNLTVTHKTKIGSGVTSLTVNSATEGAYVALTSHKKIIGTGYVKGGAATITIPATVDKDSIFITGTAFNYSPYFGQIIVDNSSSTHDFGIARAFEVYPNPNTGLFNVGFNVANKATYTLEVKNTLGQLIYQEKLTDFSGQYSKQLDVAKYGKGVYLIGLRNEANESIKKLIVY